MYVSENVKTHGSYMSFTFTHHHMAYSKYFKYPILGLATDKEPIFIDHDSFLWSKTIQGNEWICWVKPGNPSNMEHGSMENEHFWVLLSPRSNSLNLPPQTCHWSAYISVRCYEYCLLCFKTDQVKNLVFQPTLKNDTCYPLIPVFSCYHNLACANDGSGRDGKSKYFWVLEVYCPDAIVRFFGAQLLSLAWSE